MNLCGEIMDGMGWDGDRYGRDWVRMGTYGIGWGGVGIESCAVQFSRRD